MVKQKTKKIEEYKKIDRRVAVGLTVGALILTCVYIWLFITYGTRQLHPSSLGDFFLSCLYASIPLIAPAIIIVFSTLGAVLSPKSNKFTVSMVTILLVILIWAILALILMLAVDSAHPMKLIEVGA